MGDYVDRKSISGVCTFMGCCLASWSSKKQTVLVISTTEAKYVSAEKACQQALWIKQALMDYDIKLDYILVLCDNKGAIDLKPVELIFSTPPTSPHPFFDSLEDLPSQTVNLPPPQPSFDTIQHLANQPLPFPVMKPPLLPFPPHLPPLFSNNAFPILTMKYFVNIANARVKVVKKVAKSDLDSDSSIRLRFALDCVLSLTAFCQALRFAYLKTICCVLLRTNSAKLKTALRFV
nr:retrovirus-related Pol polyprotein from transposon TNT 1-94 [Tanacetum cinerariifolium]